MAGPVKSRLSHAKLSELIPTLCTRCGKCCLKQDYMLTLSATRSDIARWRRQGREDILQYEALGELWVRPSDGDDCKRCPFLRKDRAPAGTYHCRIYETRPAACRGYPYSYRQMVEDGCEIVGRLEALGIDATGWQKRRRRR